MCTFMLLRCSFASIYISLLINLHIILGVGKEIVKREISYVFIWGWQQSRWELCWNQRRQLHGKCKLPVLFVVQRCFQGNLEFCLAWLTLTMFCTRGRIVAENLWGSRAVIQFAWFTCLQQLPYSLNQENQFSFCSKVSWSKKILL